MLRIPQTSFDGAIKWILSELFPAKRLLKRLLAVFEAVSKNLKSNLRRVPSSLPAVLFVIMANRSNVAECR